MGCIARPKLPRSCQICRLALNVGALLSDQPVADAEQVDPTDVPFRLAVLARPRVAPADDDPVPCGKLLLRVETGAQRRREELLERCAYRVLADRLNPIRWSRRFEYGVVRHLGQRARNILRVEGRTESCDR